MGGVREVVLDEWCKMRGGGGGGGGAAGVERKTRTPHSDVGKTYFFMLFQRFRSLCPQELWGDVSLSSQRYSLSADIDAIQPCLPIAFLHVMTDSSQQRTKPLSPKKL